MFGVHHRKSEEKDTLGHPFAHIDEAMFKKESGGWALPETAIRTEVPALPQDDPEDHRGWKPLKPLRRPGGTGKNAG